MGLHSTLLSTVPFKESKVLCDSPNGFGATGTKIRRFTNAVVTGTDISYTADATNGDIFTLNTPGVYSISYTDGKGSATSAFGVSINSGAVTTTSVLSITAAQRLNVTGTNGNTISSVTVTYRCNTVGDTLRAHTDGLPDLVTNYGQFNINRIL